MNKKLIAVAVAGALGAPGMALAQASTVQIYGTLIMNYQYVDSGGGGVTSTAAKLKTDMINTHDTNLGFKGEEALGGGLAAWFQCESSMDVSGESARLGAAAWCGRNSAFGMKGNFGNAYVGVWDTPMKIVMGNYRPFSTAGAYGVTSLWNGTQSDINNSGTSFTRRQTNLISYASPNFSGFQAYGAYSAANEATAQTTATAASKPRLFGLGLQYANGPLMLGAGYEQHRNYNPGAFTGLPVGSFSATTGLPVVAAAGAGYTGGSDRGYSLAAAYTFMGTLKGSLIYTQNKYELAGTTATTAGDVAATAWGAYVDWAFSGPHRMRAGYTHQGDTRGSASGVTIGQYVANAGGGNTATTLYSLQYAYAFSKRTELNFGYSTVHNSNNAVTPLQSMGAKPNPGETQSAFVLGVKHTF